jgi:hypothetical protein
VRASDAQRRQRARPPESEWYHSTFFKDNVEVVTEQIRQIFESAFEKTFGEFHLESVEVSLEISADGKVGFFGSHVGLSGKSGITLSFKRKSKRKEM